MCGIAGAFFYRHRPPRHFAEELRMATRLLERRGPDEEGFFEAEGVGLGHRRLKVIDLESGQQPMRSPDGRVALVFNGEIYNFGEIRSRLEERGRRFVTHSDTESLLALYEDSGITCLHELEGMYAFAACDMKARRLHLAVDPFGKKPLYYSDAGSAVYFASEPKALLAFGEVTRRLDRVSLGQYLAFEYVPAPRTIFENIRKLEGGTYLEADEHGVRVGSVRKAPTAAVVTRKDHEWEGLFFEKFKTAVTRRLVSDVPLGIFLSGGLDSSSVLAMARAVDPARKIRTFNISFDERSFDESRHARRVSEFFGTEHIEEPCTVRAMLDEHEDILAHLDEPMADASFIPTTMLCRMVRRHVTVALSGDGGDELFCGYPTFAADEWARRIARLPASWTALMRRFVEGLPVNMDNLTLDFKLKQFFKGLGYPDHIRSQVWLGAFSPQEEDMILADPAASRTGRVYDPIERFWEACPKSSDALRRLGAFYEKFYLEGDILVKTDRASMAHALEVRSPLLDDRLAELVRSMPTRLKYSGGRTKVLFKNVMRRMLPSGIADRPKKGFGLPVAHWIRGELKDAFLETLDPAGIRRDGIFDPAAVESLLKEHLEGKRDNRKKLWSLYVFQKWKDRWLDRKPTS
ncbi:MAG: asparagine synthase (glutamine-hydrolyzing) [Candidatus Omnitrophica bacterium]|nr:asparagine synthase (glutamine-hydrolyzing) [Candidatus Omnitrophota bacterium]